MNRVCRQLMLKCFLSGPPGGHSAPFEKVLRELGYNTDLPRPQDGREGLTAFLVRALDAADLFVGVLRSDDDLNANVLLEAGVAAGLGKPVILLGDKPLRLTTPIRGIEFIHLAKELDLTEALRLRVRPQSKPLRGLRGDGTGTAPAPRKKRAVGWPSEVSQFDTWTTVRKVQELLKYTGARVDRSQQQEGAPDLVVWFDELEGSSINPLVIEVKSGQHALEHAKVGVQQLRRYLDERGASIGVVVVDDPFGRALPSRAPVPSMPIFYLTLRELQEHAKAGTVGQEILRLRNAWAHGRLDA